MCSSTLYPNETLLKKLVANSVCTDDCTKLFPIPGDVMNAAFLDLIVISVGDVIFGDNVFCVATKLFGELDGVCTFDDTLLDKSRFLSGGVTSSPVVSGVFAFDDVAVDLYQEIR